MSSFWKRLIFLGTVGHLPTTGWGPGPLGRKLGSKLGRSTFFKNMQKNEEVPQKWSQSQNLTKKWLGASVLHFLIEMIRRALYLCSRRIIRGRGGASFRIGKLKHFRTFFQLK